MELLIDTWNVLHQTGILPPESAGNGINGLVRLIGSSRWRRGKATLVCDGTPSDSCPAGALVSVVFTGPHRSADDEIMQRVATSSAKRSIIVVTSDREIIRSIKAAGSQHLGSGAFLQMLVDDHDTPQSKKVRRPTGLSEQDAAEWKERFGLDDDGAVDNLLRPNTQEPSGPEPQQKIQPPKISPTKQDEPALPEALLEEARRLLDN